MKRVWLPLLVVIVAGGYALSGEEILRQVDRRVDFSSAIFTMRMEIHLPNQGVRTRRLRAWIKGDNAYVEFLNKEDRNTRYLKLARQMWVHDTEEQNTFLISGHLLRRGMMGSDISYEDALEADNVYEKYTIQLVGEERFGNYECYVVELTARTQDVRYYRRKMWVDKATFVPVREERFALSGKLLKVQEVSEIRSVRGRSFAAVTTISDQLRRNTKTVVVLEEAEFDVAVSDGLFTRRHLER